MAIDTAPYRETLESEKKTLESELARFAKPTGTPGDYATQFEDIGRDPEDNASEVESYVDNLPIESELEHKLKDVEAALARIDAGTYGTCEVCHEEIALERLAAYPAAKTCIDHAA